MAKTRYEDLNRENPILSVPATESVNIPKDVNADKFTKIDPQTGKPFGRLPTGTGTRSIFNRYSVFFLNEGVIDQNLDSDGVINPKHMDYFDNPENWRAKTILPNGIQDISTSNIIKTAQDGNHNGMDYEWSDFLYTKHNELIPNNRLITLRRFGYPVGDNLLSKISCPSPDISRAVAWVDEETNKFEDLFHFTYGLEWRSIESQLQTQVNRTWGREGDAIGGKFGRGLSYFTEIMNGETDSIRKNDTRKVADFDPLGSATNLTLGPIDVIKQMYIRNTGLDFKQDIKIQFDFDLKSYDGIDPRVAFVDLISNLLILTFNRGQFWGGDVRYYGGRQRRSLMGDKAFTDLANGDFYAAIGNGTGSLVQKFKDIIGAATNLKDAFASFTKNMLSGIGNLLIGGGLDKLGRPELQALQAFLTGEPTGMWHLTVGNPLAPIISMGNMILEGSELKLHGALGHHDFPTKLSLICTLKHGRPRDRSDMMSMFAPQVGRTYYTEPPESLIAAMNRKRGNYGTAKTNSVLKEAQNQVIDFTKLRFQTDLKNSNRFPNHIKAAGDGSQSTNDKRISWAAQTTS